MWDVCVFSFAGRLLWYCWDSACTVDWGVHVSSEKPWKRTVPSFQAIPQVFHSPYCIIDTTVYARVCGMLSHCVYH